MMTPSLLSIIVVSLLVVGIGLVLARRRGIAQTVERRIHMLVPHDSVSLEAMSDLLGRERDWISQFIVLAAPNDTSPDHVWIKFTPTTADEFDAILSRVKEMRGVVECESDSSDEFRLATPL